MALIPVNSSNVTGVEYNAATQTLTIAFKSGTYDYLKVPQEKWDAIQKAVNGEGSVGSIISSTIVKQHQFVRHEEPRHG